MYVYIPNDYNTKDAIGNFCLHSAGQYYFLDYNYKPLSHKYEVDIFPSIVQEKGIMVVMKICKNVKSVYVNVYSSIIIMRGYSPVICWQSILNKYVQV